MLSISIIPSLDKLASTPTRPVAQEDDIIAKGRVTTSSILIYKEPTSKSKMIGSLKRDTILSITGIIVGEEEPSYNRMWYKLEDLGYAHSGNIQPVTIEPNQPVFDIPTKGFLTEVTIPFTEARWHPNHQYTIAYRLYHGCTFLGN